ncbi:MAG: PorT family protein [Bdellovibrionales bacterium]|nr:PorT family protein [Bdellovibrionales bacterium]
MTGKILLAISAVFISFAAQAQEYGFLAGVHQTTASTDVNGASTDGKFGFKAGLTMGFELAPLMKFRTGAIYNQRHFEVKAGATTVEWNFDYLDVPALFQYNINETFGLFGGLNIGININDRTNIKPSVAVTPDNEANGLIPLVQVGGNFLFEDMIGFDVYYERGLGKIGKDVKDFSTFGANFIYWF